MIYPQPGNIDKKRCTKKQRGTTFDETKFIRSYKNLEFLSMCFFGNESVCFLLKEIMEKNANSKDKIKQRQNRMIEKTFQKKTSFNKGKFL